MKELIKKFFKPDIPRLVLAVLIVYLFFLFYGKLALFNFSEIYQLLLVPVMLLILAPISLFTLPFHSLFLLALLFLPYLVSCIILYPLREKEKSFKRKLIRYTLIIFCFLIVISFFNGKRFEKCFEISECKQCWINVNREDYPGACFLQQPCKRTVWIEKSNARLKMLSCLCNEAQNEEFKNTTLNLEIENFFQNSVKESQYFKGIIEPQLEENKDAISICKLNFSQLKIKYR